MDRNEFEAWEQRIAARARRLWQAAGSPAGDAERFLDEARELVALEEVLPTTRDPMARAPVEEASLQRNLGEFPTLVDQGEEQTFPDADANDGDDDDDGPRLSDGDAADTGGVLPEDETPQADLPDISVADADVTSDAFGDDTREGDADLNDDGLTDQPAFGGDDTDEQAGAGAAEDR